MSRLQLDGNIKRAGSFLNELVFLSYYHTVVSLYQIRDYQVKNGEAQKEVQSLNDLLSYFCHTDDTKVTYTNGYHVNQAVTLTSRAPVDNTVHRPDYDNFFRAAQPVIDEQGLSPPEFNLV